MGIIGDFLNMPDSFFYSHPVFRYEEFARWKTEEGVTTPRAIHKALYYYVKIGRLINIRRGLYTVVPLGETPDTISVDPYLLSAKAAVDSVLAYHSALELYGVAYSVFEQFTFLTAHKIKSFIYQERVFQPIAIPLVLQRQENTFGIDTINRQGIIIKITNFARTFVDVLDRVELSGGWEEVVRSISNMVVLDVNAVIAYCLMLNNRILAAKVGFFLQQRQGAFKIESNLLNLLLKHKPTQPQYLTNNHLEPCQLVKKWNLIVPVRILQQSWEEPNDDV